MTDPDLAQQAELTRYRSFVSWLDGVCVDNDWSVATDVIRPAIARLNSALTGTEPGEPT